MAQRLQSARACLGLSGRMAAAPPAWQMGCSILMEEFRDRREEREMKRNGRGVKTHMTDDRTKREYLKERGEQSDQEIS